VVRRYSLPLAERQDRVKIEGLKRFKEDVQEVARGFECGIKLKDYNDVKVGDVIECYEVRLEKPSL
jgi:translation initiation factor IF-2